MENDRARFHILRFLISIIFDFFKIRFLKMKSSDLESISIFFASSFWLLRFQWRSQGMEREPLASIFWQENGNPVLRFYIWWLLQGCLKNHGSRILKIVFVEMKLQHETCEEVAMVLFSQNYQLKFNWNSSIEIHHYVTSVRVALHMSQFGQYV